MHDVAVALDEILVRDLDGADARDAADVIAAEVEQHQMLGALLGIGEQPILVGLVLVRRRSARHGAGDRADGDGARAHPHQDFRAGARNRIATEIEEVEERRRIDPPQRAVEREGRQRERRLEALREHDLEDVASQDVLLGAADHLLEFGRRRVGDRLRVDGAESRRRRTCRAAGRAHRPLPDSRSVARVSATWALTPASGRTGVTTMIVSLTASKTTMIVGRTITASGMPIDIRVGLAAGAPSAARCRSRDSRTRRPPLAAANGAGRSGFRRSARAGRRAAPRGRARRRRRWVRALRLISARGPSRAPDQVRIEADH